MSGLFDPVLGATAVAEAIDDRAWVQALCDVESALARAGASAGVLDIADALEVVRACVDLARMDPGELGRLSAAEGNPVVPLVRLLGEHAPPGAVHHGASDQDVLDSTTMLVSHRALGVILGDLGEAGALCAALACTAPYAGVAGRWHDVLERAEVQLAAARDGLCVQLDGPTAQVRSELAAELDLADPEAGWHADRSRVASLARTLDAVAGAVAAVAIDIVEPANRVAARTARAAAAQVPGLVSTLIAVTSPQHDSAAALAGAERWQAEAPALVALLRYSGGAAARVADALRGMLAAAQSDTG